MGTWSDNIKTDNGGNIITRIDAGSGVGKLKFYAGGTGGTLIATISLQKPSFSNTTGVLALLGAPLSVASVASGTIDAYEITDSDDNVVREGGVGVSGSGQNIILATTAITAPQNVQIDSFSIVAAPDDAG